MRLDELTWEVFSGLEIGSETPITDNFCKHCKCTELVLLVKLRAVPGSLAGVQRKTSAKKIPVLKCTGCDRESEGT